MFDSPRARYAGRAFLGGQDISETTDCAQSVPVARRHATHLNSAHIFEGSRESRPYGEAGPRKGTLRQLRAFEPTTPLFPSIGADVTFPDCAWIKVWGRALFHTRLRKSVSPVKRPEMLVQAVKTC